jgi:preprotein translocase subunit YajC
MEPLIFIGILVVLLWLFVIRPQRRRLSDHAAMVGELSAGDEIVTAGGLYGTILRLDEDVLTVEIAPETTVRIARGAVANVVHPEEEQEETGTPIAPNGS